MHESWVPLTFARCLRIHQSHPQPAGAAYAAACCSPHYPSYGSSHPRSYQRRCSGSPSGWELSSGTGRTANKASVTCSAKAGTVKTVGFTGSHESRASWSPSVRPRRSSARWSSACPRWWAAAQAPSTSHAAGLRSSRPVWCFPSWPTPPMPSPTPPMPCATPRPRRTTPPTHGNCGSAAEELITAVERAA